MNKAVRTVTLCASIFALTSGAAIAMQSTTGHKDAQHIKYKASKPIMKDKVEEKTWIDNLSGSLALTTNYVFRGISQTENLPAAQAGLTYSLPYGFYFNVWGSNVKFSGSDATVEIDTTLGIAGELYEEFIYDVNFARYFYPRERTFEYNELNSLFNWRFLQAGISYSANVYNVHKSGTYYNAGINYDIPSQYALNIDNLNLTALYGVYSLPRAAGNSYNDYMIALTKGIKHFSFTLQWTDTNGGQNNPPYDQSIFAFTIAAEV